MQDRTAPQSPHARVQEQIDENLKRVYKETLDEQVPDRFLALLDALRKKDEAT